MITIAVIGYIVAACILVGAFVVLIQKEGSPVTHFISMCVLALVIAVAPERAARLNEINAA